jgi:hypothetical protein
MNQGRYWHVVRNEDFNKDNVRNHRVMNPVRNENDKSEIVNRPPDRQLIEKSTGKPVPEVKMQQETVKLPEKEIQKMNPPPQEIKRVEQNSPKVKEEVLVPKEEFHKQQSERTQEPKKDTDKK